MALSVDKVFRFVQFVANKESRGWVAPEEFNIAAELAQIAVYSRLEAMFLANKKVHNDMRPFLKSASASFSVGVHAFPSDFRQFLGALDSNGEEIVEWNQTEYTANKNSTIVAPSTDYPVCVVKDDGIHVYPASITTAITVEYIASLDSANPPEWGYTLVPPTTGRPVYSSGSSTDFEFEDGLFPEIAALVLANVGVNIKDELVAQYGLAFNQAA
jgi:hypothetical protein